MREEQVLRRERGIQGGDGSHPRLSRAPGPYRARRKFVHEEMEAPWALALKQLSMRFVQRVLQTRNDADYRTVPKHKSRSILPMRADRIQNLSVPVERFLNTAIRFRRRSSGCTILQFQRHDMSRVPELACAAFCNPCERACRHSEALVSCSLSALWVPSSGRLSEKCTSTKIFSPFFPSRCSLNK